MNIFYLDKDPAICAVMHVDKHCVKMILESAQLLSTAHRVLDGVETIQLNNRGTRRVKRWILPDDGRSVLYEATHINHPSAIWARQSKDNYNWLFALFVELCTEYSYRYGKTHKCASMIPMLLPAPKNISTRPFTEPTPAMPDQYKVTGDSIQSYRNYYNGEKQRMFAWKKRNVPNWIVTN